MKFKKLRGLWVPESYEEYEKPEWVKAFQTQAMYRKFNERYANWFGIDTSLESQAESAVNDLLKEFGFSVGEQ